MRHSNFTNYAKRRNENAFVGRSDLIRYLFYAIIQRKELIEFVRLEFRNKVHIRA